MSATRPAGPDRLRPSRPRPMWHLRRSLKRRVILLTTIAVGASVAFVALGAFLTTRMQLQNTLDESLRTRAAQAASSPYLGELRDSPYPVPSAALGAGDVRLGFLYAEDTRVHTLDYGPPLSLGTEPPERQVALGQRGSSIRTISALTGENYRVVAVPSPERPDTALLIAQPLASQERVLARLGVVMLVFGSLGVLVAAVAGWAVATNGLRPVRRLTRSVEGIARTEDLTPLPVEGDDEIARLATAFNTMLAALAASRDRQRQLVADAGHELRTPLTSLRTNLDLLHQAEAAGPGAGPALTTEMRRELLEDVQAQIAELTTLIGDLVELARDDGAAPVVEPVDLAAVVEHAASRVRLRAPGVDLAVTTRPWWLVGEEAALERAVTNLLDNAVKWSPAGGAVTARLADGTLTVDDAGPGIAEADRPHVFERFWRAEESRTMPGSGLGLSIVRQAADRHAGTVSVGDSPAGGARLELRLPGQAEPFAAPADAGPPVTPPSLSVAGPAQSAPGRPSSGSRRTPPPARSAR